MAESRAEQGAFGWAAESAAVSDGEAATRATLASGLGGGELRPHPDLTDETGSAPSSSRVLTVDLFWHGEPDAQRTLGLHKAEDGTLPARRLGGWGIRFIPGELRAWVERGDAAMPRR